MSSSRLDRLFVLIETGSSPLTRKAASQQLGEVVKYHSHELQHLLNRVFQLLSSSSWDTRIAASQAVEAICLNTPEWIPPERCKVDKIYHPIRLAFDTFDIHSVIMSSACLMASDNIDFVFHAGVEDKELVHRQVELINSKLNMGVNVGNIVSDIDVATSLQSDTTDIKDKKNVSEVLNLNYDFLSSREMNRVKRKVKQISTKLSSEDNINDSLGTTSSENSSADTNSIDKRIKTEDTNDASKFIKNFVDEELEWPFELFTAKLKQNLFSCKWEIRHGAACALREIMKVHGKTAGYSAYLDKDQMELNHQLWLEDLSLHLLCILALDRFGDFISDQVVAPVRETCAQCLGIVINMMDESRVLQVVNILMCLLKKNEWEIRHGALLGIKYMLAVKEDLQDSILIEIFPLISNCFGDPVDDVSAEAASALNPVSAKIVKLMPDSVPILMNQLWKLLSSQDELGVACNSFMALLASLFMNSDVQTSVSSDMIINIIPYLWAFLYYNASSVRKSAVQTICSISHSKICISRWNQVLLQNTIRHIFQRVLLEPSYEIRLLAEEAWCNIVKNGDVSILRNISWQLFGTWLFLSMQSSKVPFDESLFILEKNDQSIKSEFTSSDSTELKLYLGGNETVLPEVRERNVVHIRCTTARQLGLLLHCITQPVPDSSSQLPESSVVCYCNILQNHLNSKSSLQRMISALVLNEWARLVLHDDIFPSFLKDRLQQCLLESIYFDEIAMSYTKVLQDTKDYILHLKNNSIPIDENLCNKVLRLNEIETLTSENTFKSTTDGKLDKKKVKELQDKRQAIYTAVCLISAEQSTLTITTQAVIAGAVLTLKSLPNKLNPVIKPLMDAIKKEENEHLQKMAASHLARLVNHCTDREPSPNVKIIMNLCNLLCSDSEFTPQIHLQNCKNEPNKTCNCEKYNGILTLTNQQKVSEKVTVLKRMNSSSSIRSVGRPSLTDYVDENFIQQSQLQKVNKTQRLGASYAVTKIAKLQGAELVTKSPVLWNYLYTNIKEIDSSLETDADTLKNQDELAEKLICSLQVLEVVCPYIHDELLPQITSLLRTLCLILNYPYCAVRHMAARCIAVLAKRDVISVMKKIPTLILPFVNAADSVIKRQGGVEAIEALVETLKLEIIPYIVLFVIPLLGRMSDQDNCIRSMASHTFGMLIQLMPLETVAPSPSDLPEELTETVEKQRLFLNQLLNPKCIPDFKLSIEINAELRSYQQCGVNWLAFLNKYQLHGILCDDMGLGKTLQSLCIIAEDHYRRDILYTNEKRADSVALPSLVVCPPTLISHWVYEIKKFIPTKYLDPLQYEGIPSERERLRSMAMQYNLIVASYDIVRKDCDFFSSIKWNYCILDEGHIIKNGKTKISKAIKRLIANHRLILSGTPIQNNVLELWSLFDFLMPGYLGNEKQFTAKFSKPILSSRDPKSSVKEQEAGIFAMETLHQKVLPFILRRMKGDVLKDLPPKITQDYYCDLSPIQQILYEDFSKSDIQKNTINAIKSTQSCNSFSMFQALRYLQSVCNHPKLVLTREHPLYEEITRQLEEKKSSLSDINHAAKLIALKQLLIDCGIGGSAESDDVTKSNYIVSQHRALIFCQLKAMLNILETDLFKVHLPNVTYLRLDGSVSSNERYKIVTSFNEDPSIDVLLLTTQIGGLGLNLTGADTVIFVEHDWSPMKDLQAMDRAHRIGQKKVVNVYRLITRATLEQKIMGLQEFKLKTANTVITAENSSLTTMSTEKLLDLFALNAGDKDKNDFPGAASSKKSNTVNEFMKSLPELWDSKDYEEEYDMSSFISSLRQ